MTAGIGREAALHEGEGGTPIADYVGPAGQLQPATQAPLVSSDTLARAALRDASEQPDSTLKWAKRVGLAIFATSLGTLIYSSNILDERLQYWFLTLLIGATWAGGAWLLGKLRNWVQWMVISLVAVSQLQVNLFTGLDKYFGSIKFMGRTDILNARGIAQYQNWYNESIIYLIIAASITVLAGFTVVRSLPGWRKIIGLLTVAIAGAGGILQGLDFSIGANVKDIDTIASLHSWGQILALIALPLMAILYLWPRRHRSTNPPDGKQAE